MLPLTRVRRAAQHGPGPGDAGRRGQAGNSARTGRLRVNRHPCSTFATCADPCVPARHPPRWPARAPSHRRPGGARGGSSDPVSKTRGDDARGCRRTGPHRDDDFRARHVVTVVATSPPRRVPDAVGHQVRDRPPHLGWATVARTCAPRNRSSRTPRRRRAAAGRLPRSETRSPTSTSSISRAGSAACRRESAKQGVDEVAHLANRVADLTHGRGYIRRHPVLHSLADGPDAGQRRAQVVRDPGDELAPVGLCPPLQLAVPSAGPSRPGRLDDPPGDETAEHRGDGHGGEQDQKDRGGVLGLQEHGTRAGVDACGDCRTTTTGAATAARPTDRRVSATTRAHRTARPRA